MEPIALFGSKYLLIICVLIVRHCRASLIITMNSTMFLLVDYYMLTSLTYISCKACHAVALVFVDKISTSSSILTWCTGTFIDILKQYMKRFFCLMLIIYMLGLSPVFRLTFCRKLTNFKADIHLTDLDKDLFQIIVISVI